MVEKKERYRHIIHDKKIAFEKADPNNAIVPLSSENIKGKMLLEIENAFRDAGFTDIRSIGIPDNFFLFKQTGKVERVTIGGRSEYETEDYFPVDTIISIYYYQ